MRLSFARFLFIIKPVSSTNPGSNPIQTTLCLYIGILSYVSRLQTSFRKQKKRTKNQDVPNFQFSFHSLNTMIYHSLIYFCSEFCLINSWTSFTLKLLSSIASSNSLNSALRISAANSFFSAFRALTVSSKFSQLLFYRCQLLFVYF